jgi:hypothetical protein
MEAVNIQNRTSTPTLNLNTEHFNLDVLSSFNIEAPPAVLKIEPRAIIRDDSKIECGFNVLPNKPVSETFKLKEYRVWDSYAEATFDREYISSMKKSPDHLIFLTGLVHTQKLIYVYLSQHWGFQYDPNGDEQIKIWPTSLQVEMPAMIRKNKNVVQKMWVKELREEKNDVFSITVSSTFHDLVTINGVCKIFKI